MNIRKQTDYRAMYEELNKILLEELPQMEEIYAIGRAICKRPEKGAAVMAAEYLQTNFSDRSGVSPRNVRRMREFYRAYENDQVLLRLALSVGWTWSSWKQICPTPSESGIWSRHGFGIGQKRSFLKQFWKTHGRMTCQKKIPMYRNAQSILKS